MKKGCIALGLLACSALTGCDGSGVDGTFGTVYTQKVLMKSETFIMAGELWLDLSACKAGMFANQKGGFLNDGPEKKYKLFRTKCDGPNKVSEYVIGRDYETGGETLTLKKSIALVNGRLVFHEEDDKGIIVPISNIRYHLLSFVLDYVK